MQTLPRPRRKSGQKRLPAVVSGLICARETAAETVIRAPIAIRRRASNRPAILPIKSMAMAEARALGICSSPLCMAV